MIKISVIIPAYNAEKTIDRCLNSIVNQTLKELEIIIVNDGSKDKTDEVCKTWEKKDSRIKLISNRNMGCSYSRNYGIRIAKGKYLTFVDSDDFIDENMYFELYQKSILLPDIIVSGVKYLDENQNIKYVENPKIYRKKPYKNKGFNSPCNKLYLRSLLVREKILFPENTHMGEDLVFNFKLFYVAKKIEIVKNSYYNYVDNYNSVTKNNMKKIEIIQSMEEIYTFLKMKNKFNLNKYIYNKFIQIYIIAGMYSLCENLKIEYDDNWKIIIEKV
ncbi:MAG: glycosyltransferase family 2 protein, partial [Cetobacterium sp.]